MTISIPRAVASAIARKFSSGTFDSESSSVPSRSMAISLIGTELLYREGLNVAPLKSYDHHCSAPFFRALVVSATKSTWEKEPTTSSNQPRVGTFSCAYCPYERQGTGGTIDAIHRDVVRGGVRYIGELSGRMDGYRGRRLPGSYRSCGRQGAGGDVDGVHRDVVRGEIRHISELTRWIHYHGDRTRSRSNRSSGRQGAGGDVDGVHRDIVRTGIRHISELSRWIHYHRDRICSRSNRSCRRQGSSRGVDGVHRDVEWNTSAASQHISELAGWIHDHRRGIAQSWTSSARESGGG